MVPFCIRIASKLWICFHGSVTQQLHAIAYEILSLKSKLTFFRSPNLTQRRDNLYGSRPPCKCNLCHPSRHLCHPSVKYVQS